MLTIPGAKSVYFAHNHPSGTGEQSQADKNITNRLKSVMDGTGLESKGMIVVIHDGRGSIYPTKGDEVYISTTKQTKDKKRPVTERIFQNKRKAPVYAATSVDKAMDIVADVSGGKNVSISIQYFPLISIICFQLKIACG